METNDELNAGVPIEQDGAMQPADNRVPTESHKLRLQRVLDYQAQALANANVLESNLASINSGLLRIALRLEETIEEAMARTPVPVERMQRVYQAIDTHLRVARQIDRFAQIELRAAEPCKLSLKKKIDIDAVVGDSSGPGARPSEDLNN